MTRFSGIQVLAFAASALLLAQPARLAMAQGCFAGFDDPVYSEILLAANISGTDTFAAADFDGDGNLDIVVPAGGYEDVPLSLAIAHGDGSGMFTRQTVVHEGPFGFISSLSVGDVTGNGELDILVATLFPEEWLLPGIGGGAFGERILIPGGLNARGSLIEDVNGDGLGDVIVSYSGGEVHVRLSEGGGALGEPQVYMTGPTPSRLSAGDVSGNGLPDIVVGAVGHSLHVLINSAEGGRAGSHFEIESLNFVFNDIVVADLDGASPDEIVVSDGNGFTTLRRNGSSDYENLGFFQGRKNAAGVLVADFDLDGRPDAATTMGDHKGVMTQRGLGDGRFAGFPDVAPMDTFTLGDGVIDSLDVTILLLRWGQTEPNSADVNRDGVVDVLDLVRLLANWGPFTCWYGQMLSVTQDDGQLGATFFHIVAGDFDNDGDVDLVFRRSYPPALGFLRNRTIE